MKDMTSIEAVHANRQIEHLHPLITIYKAMNCTTLIVIKEFENSHGKNLESREFQNSNLMRLFSMITSKSGEFSTLEVRQFSVSEQCEV
ncbi:hypothetical protein [Thalassoglobus sp.]|uniref:hypothetical protein n=1 Tax=Thalassoglobus sp. TaxID=2795869 RepID=UPI003AA7ED57